MQRGEIILKPTVKRKDRRLAMNFSCPPLKSPFFAGRQEMKEMSVLLRTTIPASVRLIPGSFEGEKGRPGIEGSKRPLDEKPSRRYCGVTDYSNKWGTCHPN
jgi:hypothetical protein